jgi:hypothetical protein
VRRATRGRRRLARLARLARPAHLVIALGTASAVCPACASGTRDVVPETRDVQVAATPATGSSTYVARRTLGFVALTRQTGLGAEIGGRAVEHLADALDVCATNLAAKGRLVDGAIRIDAIVAAGGSVAITHVTVAPGDAVAANALLCVMAPLKLMTFSPEPDARNDGGARSFAIDASWGPQGAAQARPGPN